MNQYHSLLLSFSIIFRSFLSFIVPKEFHIISSHLISLHLILSHLITKNLVSSHSISFHLISFHLILSHQYCYLLSLFSFLPILNRRLYSSRSRSSRVRERTLEMCTPNDLKKQKCTATKEGKIVNLES